jgi:hypothetical protein
MTDDPNFQAAQAHIAALEHTKSIDTIVQAGREEYGESNFDDMSSDLVNTVGAANAAAFTVALAATDHPTALVAYLSANPDEAAAIAKLPGARKAVALERIQTRIRPNMASAPVDNLPSWKRNAGDRGSLFDDSISDEAWCRRYRAKNGNHNR